MRNSSSLDWLRFMHTPNDYRVSRKIFSTNYDKDVARAKLALWYNKIEEYGYDTFTTVANFIENHYERILNFFVNRSTNAAAEAFNAKIKAFRASFRGVVDMSFFLFRLAKVYA